MNSNEKMCDAVDTQTLEALEFDVGGECLFVDVTCDGVLTPEGFKPTRLISWELSSAVHPITKKFYEDSTCPAKFKLAQTISNAIKTQLSIT